MRRFEVICGGALLAEAHGAETTIQLDVNGPGKNVNCHITDLPSAMVLEVPDVLLDLFDLAAYVHCADQRMPRGSDKLTDYGRDWRRDIHFTIPLRQPER
jgi:hypothetical protein